MQLALWWTLTSQTDLHSTSRPLLHDVTRGHWCVLGHACTNAILDRCGSTMCFHNVYSHYRATKPRSRILQISVRKTGRTSIDGPTGWLLLMLECEGHLETRRFTTVCVHVPATCPHLEPTEPISRHHKRSNLTLFAFMPFFPPWPLPFFSD